MTLYTLFVIDYVGVTALVDPQFAYDDVVHGRGDLAPRVVMLAIVEFQVYRTKWEYLMIINFNLDRF